MVHLLTQPLQECEATRITVEWSRRKQEIRRAIAQEPKRCDQMPTPDFVLCHEDRTDCHAQAGTGGLQAEIEMFVGLAVTMIGIGFADAVPVCPGVHA